MKPHGQGTSTGLKDALAMLGYGEAAQAFVKGWRQQGVQRDITAYDIKTNATDANAAAAKKLEYAGSEVEGAADMAGLLAQSGLVFSLVTADQAASAAAASATGIPPGAFFLDGNSCAPNTKQASAQLIEDAGAHYIDMAIMAPVHPKLHKTPILLSGSKAEQAHEILAELGMNAQVEPGAVGRASSIKMIRSIMVKGIEALTAECLLAGRRAGVEDIVLASLEKSWPEFDWQNRAAYNLERMMVHGERRAAEMREVVQTVGDLGLNNGMAQATSIWQQQIGDLTLDAGADDLEQRLDAILAGLSGNT